MTLPVWIALVVAGLAVLFAARVWWSTSGARYRAQCKRMEEMERRVAAMDKDIDRYRHADLMLREANRTLKKTLVIREEEVDDLRAKLRTRDRDINELKRDNQRIHTANDKLNEILGNQEEANKQMARDLDMLKDQVVKLRAQLGLEP